MKASAQIAIALGVFGAAAYVIHVMTKAKNEPQKRGMLPVGALKLSRLQIGGDESGGPSKPYVPTSAPALAPTYDADALTALQQLQVSAVTRNNPFWKFLMAYNLSDSPQNAYDPNQLRQAIAEYQSRNGMTATGRADASTLLSMQSQVEVEQKLGVDYFN